jgi:hypothetical protein
MNTYHIIKLDKWAFTQKRFPEWCSVMVDASERLKNIEVT